MKTLLFFLFIPCLLIAQEYEQITIFDMAGVTGDSTRVISLKIYEGGLISEVEFASVNCNTLTLEVGYCLTETRPRYPSTFSGLTNPVTLDKTAITRTYLGVESNGFVIDFSEYNANYLCFELTDDASCTYGEIILFYTR